MKKENVKLVATTTKENYIVVENGLEYVVSTEKQNGKVIELKVYIYKVRDENAGAYAVREEVGNILRLQESDRDSINIRDGYNVAEIVANYAVIKEVVMLAEALTATTANAPVK